MSRAGSSREQSTTIHSIHNDMALATRRLDDYTLEYDQPVGTEFYDYGEFPSLTQSQHGAHPWPEGLLAMPRSPAVDPNSCEIAHGGSLAKSDCAGYGYCATSSDHLRYAPTMVTSNHVRYVGSSAPSDHLTHRLGRCETQERSFDHVTADAIGFGMFRIDSPKAELEAAELFSDDPWFSAWSHDTSKEDIGPLQSESRPGIDVVRRAWICKDISTSGFLQNCKACRGKKTYGASYNAASHLRRIHFNASKKRRGRRGKKLDDMRISCPPMSELQHWMYATYEAVVNGIVIDVLAELPEGVELPPNIMLRLQKLASDIKAQRGPQYIGDVMLPQQATFK